MFHRQRTQWSLVEIDYLIKNYLFLNTEDLAIDLRKTKKEIIDQINQLKTKSGDNILYCPDECNEFLQTIDLNNKTNKKCKFCGISLKTDYSVQSLHSVYKNSSIKQIKNAAGFKSKVDRLIIPKDAPKKGKFNSLKSGMKKDLGVSVRSGWEGNVLRYLKYKKIKWEYEPKVFIFEGIKHGTVSYTPDIYLPEKDIWIEIKGFMSPTDKTKIRRFKKFYPEEYEKLHAITGSSKTQATKFFESQKIPIYAYYNDLNKKYGNLIDKWE